MAFGNSYNFTVTFSLAHFSLLMKISGMFSLKSMILKAEVRVSLHSLPEVPSQEPQPGQCPGRASEPEPDRVETETDRIRSHRCSGQWASQDSVHIALMPRIKSRICNEFNSISTLRDTFATAFGNNICKDF